MVKAPRFEISSDQVDSEDLDMMDVLRFIRDAADAKKGEEIKILDMEDQVDFLDYLILVNGTTVLHNRAIADNIVSELARYDIIPDGLNGYEHGEWILVDLGPVVVHVFTPALRQFYRLEELWAAGRVVELN